MAGKTISNMTSGGPLDGTELVEVSQGGSTRKIALSTIRKWIADFIQQRITLQAEWQFDDSTSSNDPGGGKFRLNNSNQPTSTFIYINDKSKGDVDFGNIFNNLSSGDSIYIQERKDSQNSILFEVNGAATDNGGWWQIPVTNGDGFDIEDGEECAFVFYFSA